MPKKKSEPLPKFILVCIVGTLNGSTSKVVKKLKAKNSQSHQVCAKAAHADYREEILDGERNHPMHLIRGVRRTIENMLPMMRASNLTAIVINFPASIYFCRALVTAFPSAEVTFHLPDNKKHNKLRKDLSGRVKKLVTHAKHK